jgi:Flp pilus assembly protein TadG
VTVEFFLILPLILLVLIGGVQVVAVAQSRIELVGAAREGVRIAATAPDPSLAVAAVQRALSPSVRDRARISVSRPLVVGQSARVVVSLRHLLGNPFPESFGVDLSASATMRVER